MRTTHRAPSAPHPAPPAEPNPPGRRRPLWALPAAIAAGALVLRIPAYLATRHLSFDDGVYGASAVAMREGGLPFRDVFSSQGPLFLPLVWLADLVGLRTFDAPRLLALASAVAVVLATWSAARALRLSAAAAGTAAGLVATSGSVLWVTGPLTSDGPSLALATAAVAAALWYRRSPTLARAIVVGMLIGAALSVKSLLVPAAVTVGLALLPGRSPRTAAAGIDPSSVGSGGHGRWAHLVAAVATAGVLSLAVALPWGLGNVWDQAFQYHLDAAGSRTPLPNLRKVISTLGDRDLPLLLAALASIGLVAAARLRTRHHPAPSAVGSGEKRTLSGLPTLTVGNPLGVGLLVVWLGATVLVLAAEHPLWRNHVAHLVPPAALLIGNAFERLRTDPPIRHRTTGLLALVGLAALAVPYHVVHMSEVLWPAPVGKALAAARADLRALPAGAWVISDDPGVVWRAGRRTPDDLVDASILRIESGRLTADSLARAAADRRVCAVLIWSDRFADLAPLPDLLRRGGYSAGPGYGGVKTIWRRPCLVAE